MKILYIGNYRDGTGWGNAGLNNILALHSAGVDVVPRAITFEAADKDYPEEIKTLEKKSTDGCDVCIQHTLPHLYSYDSRYKNIGYLAVETSNFTDTGWQHYANLMDEIWVPSEAAESACISSGVTKPIKIAPHSLDMTKYKAVNGGNQIKEMQSTFNFVFIGEFVERKNLKALIQAFHMEFDTHEPVNLFIKTSKTSIENIQRYAKEIKNGLKIRTKYKEEIIVAGRLEDVDYISVLGQCHCFVMPSRGEAFCIPALEAMALNIPVIHTANTGMDDFCIGEAVPSSPTPCLGAMSTLSNLDTAKSDWREINIRELCAAMRRAYQNWHSDTGKIQKGQVKAVAETYDHKSIGHEMKELLNDS
jgi:glycosyltransferase involved in cell wall biosynthesis|tara:strand:+ start:3464 stop:4549 length:1086 start_codon:yes stop_codon:yes gene_type:complete